MLEMFADSTVGESYHHGRLITEETDSGNVALVAYGWMKIAEYDETEGQVTAFFGHKSVESRTISRWLNRVVEQVGQRRDVNISPESPTVRSPNDGVEFIGEYIGDWNDKSPVEEKAEKAVIDSLAHLQNVV